MFEDLGGEHLDGVFSRTSNGDYVVTDVQHESYDGNGTVGVMVSINFKAQFGYYLLNNYWPSFLIFIIAYTTFFFPLDNFNERVMVSLTSLLVLATFFSQASESTVHTPYVKMIDIWYAGLIGFNFATVVLNVVINCNSSQKVHPSSAPKKNFLQLIPKNTTAEALNKWAKVMTAATFIVFLLGYALVAL